ncbi:hypothetical protein MSG28_013968 [Choristoneura fumiferana]|uniref:Uncharacterized protein n=1 Tax=Choristoneura fumiferana TaxID=7141 RepID=A0ACC0KA40_CHOFU|nr:hypothetical protein MSG28_013968 [Choristoneura fumiferana]
MSTCSSETDMLESFGEGAEQFVESTQEPQDININNIVKADDECCSEMQKVPESSQKLEKKQDICQQKEVKKGDGPDPAKAPHKKAKQMRRERTLEKLKEKGIDITTLNNTNKNKEKQVEDFINELPNDVKLKLEVKLVRNRSCIARMAGKPKKKHLKLFQISDGHTQ